MPSSPALFSSVIRMVSFINATAALLALVGFASTASAQHRAESMVDHGDYIVVLTTHEGIDPKNWEQEFIPKRNVLTVKVARDSSGPTRYALTIHIAEEIPHAQAGARSARSYAVIYGDYDGAIGAAKKFFARKGCCPCSG